LIGVHNPVTTATATAFVSDLRLAGARRNGEVQNGSTAIRELSDRNFPV
jgi:hypothetical protein